MDQAGSYRVIFKGEIEGGLVLDEVKQRLLAMLKRKDDATVDKLFEQPGRTVVLKIYPDYESARRYSEHFNKSGAVSIVEPAGDAQPLSLHNPKADQTPPPPPPGDSEEGGRSAVEGPEHPLRRADDIKQCLSCGKTIKASEPICPHCNQPQRMSWKCDNCGKQIPNYRDICVCGYRRSTKSLSDTKPCPSCGEEIKRAAKKCRYCNHILDASILAEGEGTYEPKEAGKALTYSLVGILCFGIVLGPMAIYHGNAALKEIKANPHYKGHNKALAGLIIGIVDTLLSSLFIMNWLGKMA